MDKFSPALNSMPYDLEYIDLELKDTPESNLLEALDQAIRFLKQKREESKPMKLFINCPINQYSDLHQNSKYLS